MKKEINISKILIVLGLTVAIAAVLLDVLICQKAEDAMLLSSSSTLFVLALAVVFVFAGNSAVQNMGYCLSILICVDAVYILLFGTNDMGIVFAIGMLLMTVGALLHYLIVLLALCGFVKEKSAASSIKNDSSLLEQLVHYKDLHRENILSDEEFARLKKSILETNDKKGNSIEDLKKWKKLLDQEVITAEEFSSIKAAIIQG